MIVTDTFETTAGQTRSLEVTVAECRVIAASTLHTWVTRPAKDALKFSTYARVGAEDRTVLRYDRVSPSDYAALQELLAVTGPRLTGTYAADRV